MKEYDFPRIWNEAESFIPVANANKIRTTPVNVFKDKSKKPPTLKVTGFCALSKKNIKSFVYFVPKVYQAESYPVMASNWFWKEQDELFGL